MSDPVLMDNTSSNSRRTPAPLPGVNHSIATNLDTADREPLSPDTVYYEVIDQSAVSFKINIAFDFKASNLCFFFLDFHRGNGNSQVEIQGPVMGYR